MARSAYVGLDYGSFAASKAEQYIRYPIIVRSDGSSSMVNYVDRAHAGGVFGKQDAGYELPARTVNNSFATNRQVSASSELPTAAACCASARAYSSARSPYFPTIAVARFRMTSLAFFIPNSTNGER
jgi:hypothetical protein